MNWAAILLTLKLAGVVSLLLLLIGLPLGYWLAFSKFRWKFLIEAVIALPLILPPTVLGFYLLLAFGSNGPFARTVGPLAFSFSGLMIASVIYSLPFAVQPFAAAFGSIDKRLLHASALLGASRLRTFVYLVLPLSLSGVVTGVVLSFAHTIGEFGVVLMVGGNIEGVTRTVSIDLYDRVQELDYAAAHETALLLLAFSFVALALVYGSNRHIWQNWFGR